jgi:hypothetical protein
LTLEQGGFAAVHALHHLAHAALAPAKLERNAGERAADEHKQER